MNDSCNILATWQLVFRVLKCGIFKGKNRTIETQDR